MQNFDDMGEIAYIQSKKNGAQINDIANQIEELQNSGVDTEARASIAQLESQYSSHLNDYATYKIAAWIPKQEQV